MKKIKIIIEVDDQTSNKRIVHELKKFCSFNFWKGNEGKIKIEK